MDNQWFTTCYVRYAIYASQNMLLQFQETVRLSCYVLLKIVEIYLYTTINQPQNYDGSAHPAEIVSDPSK